jgi:hypothetical protein
VSYDDSDRAAIDQLEDLLDAYADARLMPTGPVLARMRTAVLAQAAAAAADRRRVEDLPVPTRRFALTALHVPRRAFALGLAASLTLGTSAAVFAAPPGSAFYNARLVIETVLLPSKPDEQLAARQDHLDARLREAEAAAASGDIVALEAALIAFQSELDAAVAGSDADLARLARLQAAIEKHVAKLQELAARLPTDVARDNAVEHAIDAGQKAVEKLKDKSKSGPNRPTPKPGQGGGNPDPPANPNAPKTEGQNVERP